MTEFDCKTCGACCVATSADDYVPLTRLDRRRLPTKYQKKIVDVRDERERIDPAWVGALPLKRSTQGLSAGALVGIELVCTALKGRVGKEVSCDVYDQRPAFCRVLEPGSEVCIERRREQLTAVAGYTVEIIEEGAEL